MNFGWVPFSHTSAQLLLQKHQIFALPLFNLQEVNKSVVATTLSQVKFVYDIFEKVRMKCHFIFFMVPTTKLISVKIVAYWLSRK